MYIVFIDESGQPGGWDNENNNLTKNSSKFFTLGRIYDRCKRHLRNRNKI